MIITDAKPVRKGRTQIYIDGEAAVQVSARLFGESRFQIGGEISDEELHELVRNSERSLAHEKAIWLLSVRDYPKRALFDRLCSEFDSQCAEEVCDELEESGLISDEKYARLRAQTMIETKGYSRRRAAWELMKKGISRDLAQEAADEVEYDPAESAARLIERRYPNVRSNETELRRAAAFLERRGYSPRESRAAFELLNDL